MRKILCLILCLILSCMMLVACSGNEIGDYIKNYPETTEKVERLDLNLYIITGDSTTETSKTSVATRISGHTKTTYNTVLNVFYVKESEYESTVINAINNGGTDIPHIILINSEAMMNKLVNSASGNKLADLTEYYLSEEYGRLNTQIASSLISSSRIDGKLYTVPNNRVLGEYTYLVINKEVAMQTLHYTNTELSAYKSLDDAAQLIAEMYSAGYTEEQVNSYVRVVSGSYKLREELSENNFCNIINVPTVTSADAFSSAFAIVKSTEKYNDRAMQIIYAINTDIELRNFLQYGVEGANYNTVDGDVVRINSGDNVYDMNLMYTGDVFKADFCSELKWTKETYNYGVLQNNDSKSD